MAVLNPFRTAIPLAYLAFLITIGLHTVVAQSTTATMATTTSDWFSPLNGLPTPIPYQTIGGQNFTQCCLRAVKDWQQGSSDITVARGEFSSNPAQVFMPHDMNSSGAAFPCGDTYGQDPDGAPEVLVTYSWCKANCDGWQQSTNADLAQWIIPFVGFILPAAVFCLNIPRRMVTDIPDDLFFIENFRNDWYDLWRYLAHELDEDPTILGFIINAFRALAKTLFALVLMALRAGVALTLGLVNVVVWVVIVFSTAAPMILSGLYEAAIDRQVLSSMEREIRHHQHKTDNTEISYSSNKVYRIKYQVHLLYAILVGNLELWKPIEDEKSTQAAQKSQKDSVPDVSPGLLQATIDDATNKNTEISGPVAANTTAGSTAEALPTGDHGQMVTEKSDASDKRVPDSAAWEHVNQLLAKMDTNKEVDRANARTRLNTMLECQASFGATIGAPIVFFLGAFILSIESNVNAYGDNDDSHTLAFGEWWTTIPHVAIVAGCLLAGNNPNTLEAIYSGITNAPPEEINRKTTFWSPFYKPFYESLYQPVWMWERGRSKRNWVQAVQDMGEYNDARLQTGEGPEHEPDRGNTDDQPSQAKPRIARVFLHLKRLWYISRFQHRLSQVPSLGLVGWISLILTASVLMVIPWVLAYVTSYFTPTVGLSCRSFTFVLYFVCQVWLSILWFIDFPSPAAMSWVGGNSFLSSAFVAAIILGFVGSAFSAVAGTFMQIIGVYRNCKCSVPMSSWISGNASFIISTNSPSMIYYAKRYWLGTGVASIVLLSLFCYFGWWYQRHWRHRFQDAVDEVLMIEKKRKTGSNAPPQVAATAESNCGPGDTSNSKVVETLVAIPAAGTETKTVEQQEQQPPK